jgi:RHS repeat-associated protein
LSNFTYDKNGNIIKDTDPVTNQARQFVFNGDNKQTEVKDANGNPIGKYFYDGEGKRVKKVTATETTIFVYSGGKLVAEYSTQISQNPTISYTTTDHLGSPRVITDKLGNVKSRRDFMPFGEDIFADIGGRTAAQKYSSNADDIRQKFTGYQKDSETSLDFAEARMYENRYGRFTAVDPLMASGKSANPQSFNRYMYVLDDPINATDSTGAIPDWIREKATDARGEFLRPTWVDRKAGSEEAWTEMAFTNRDGDQIVLDPLGPYYAGGGDLYLGFSRNGITQGTGIYAYTFMDEQADNATAAGKWLYNCLAGASNLGYSIAGYASHEYIMKGQPRPMPSVEYYQYSNETEARAANLYTVASIVLPLTRAGSASAVPTEFTATTTGRLSYTRSNLQFGQQMHREYKVAEELAGIGTKEFRLASGRRIDFLDTTNNIIYELKPFNPRQTGLGQKQLQCYKQELRSVPEFQGREWWTVLDTY